MSSATRRPYLTEGVHVAVDPPIGDSVAHCQSAFVSELGSGTTVELWVLKKPEPGYVWARYDDEHHNGTWHYAH